MFCFDTQEHEALLASRAVAYVNVDVAVYGNRWLYKEFCVHFEVETISW